MKVLSFIAGGTTVLPDGAQGAELADFQPTKIAAELSKAGIFIHAQRVSLLGGIKRQMFVEFPLKGSSFQILDAERSMGRAAIGAIAGGILLGPLGFLEGGAIGSGTRSVYEVRYGSDMLLLELSSGEKKSLLALGHLREGDAGALPEVERPLLPRDKNAEEALDRYCVTCQSKQPAAFASVPRAWGIAGAGVLAFVGFSLVGLNEGEIGLVVLGVALGLGGWGATVLQEKSKQRIARKGPAFCRRCAARC